MAAKKTTGTKRKRRLAIVLVIAVACMLAAGALFAGKVIRLNVAAAGRYPVWGVDVSAYQGDIDWPVLAAQGPDFAFIKATEGSGYTDPRFAANWQAAGEAGLMWGAYHFFSFESPGTTQAENFLAALPRGEAMLPPVVDVELYGDYQRSPPKAAGLRAELDTLLARLEGYSGEERYIDLNVFAGSREELAALQVILS